MRIARGMRPSPSRIVGAEGWHFGPKDEMTPMSLSRSPPNLLSIKKGLRGARAKQDTYGQTHKRAAPLHDQQQHLVHPNEVALGKGAEEQWRRPSPPLLLAGASRRAAEWQGAAEKNTRMRTGGRKWAAARKRLQVGEAVVVLGTCLEVAGEEQAPLVLVVGLCQVRHIVVGVVQSEGNSNNGTRVCDGEHVLGGAAKTRGWLFR